MIVKSFKQTWTKFKNNLTEEDLDYFYNVIHGGKEIDRVLSCSMRDYNPTYNSHYFPICRCHTNVFFALYLLNDRKLIGDYSIITNDNHSAIINTKTNIIYDPTYMANNIDLNNTVKHFESNYDILTYEEHLDTILNTSHIDI